MCLLYLWANIFSAQQTNSKSQESHYSPLHQEAALICMDTKVAEVVPYGLPHTGHTVSADPHRKNDQSVKRTKTQMDVLYSIILLPKIVLTGSPKQYATTFLSRRQNLPHHKSLHLGWRISEPGEEKLLCLSFIINMTEQHCRCHLFATFIQTSLVNTKQAAKTTRQDIYDNYCVHMKLWNEIITFISSCRDSSWRNLLSVISFSGSHC